MYIEVVCKGRERVEREHGRERRTVDSIQKYGFRKPKKEKREDNLYFYICPRLTQYTHQTKKLESENK